MTTKKAARTGKNRIRGGGETAKRSRPAEKRTERRAGDKSTRVSKPQKGRQVSLREPEVRTSELERVRPKRSKELAREVEDDQARRRKKK